MPMTKGSRKAFSLEPRRSKFRIQLSKQQPFPSKGCGNVRNQLTWWEQFTIAEKWVRVRSQDRLQVFILSDINLGTLAFQMWTFFSKTLWNCDPLHAICNLVITHSVYIPCPRVILIFYIHTKFPLQAIWSINFKVGSWQNQATRYFKHEESRMNYQVIFKEVIIFLNNCIFKTGIIRINGGIHPQEPGKVFSHAVLGVEPRASLMPNQKTHVLPLS